MPQTPEMLLLNLGHYVKPADSSAEDTEEEKGKIKALDPFSEQTFNLVILYVILYLHTFFHIYIPLISCLCFVQSMYKTKTQYVCYMRSM